MGMIANINTVARFEIKTLFRSWFFRIFSILTLLMLFGTNIGMLTQDSGQMAWTIKSLSSNIPYFNVAFLNLAQAIIAIFIAADFLRRDKKLDTTEVIYTRSMTNWEYVWGKTIGVLVVFGALNFLMFAMVLIINIVVSGLVVHWMAYLVYPFLISFPTLIFTLGLAFLLMSLLRNQAVTLIILLGVAALSMFLLNDKVSFLFDYMAFSMPMMWSDFIGTGQNFMIILQRSIYLLLGLSMIFATILLLKRLPQSRPASIAATLMLLILSVSGIAGLGYYWQNYSKDKKFVQEVRSLNDDAKGNPTVKVLEYSIDLNHEGNELSAVAEVEIINDSETKLSEALFSLNPGLELSGIQFDGSNIDYSRDEHLVMLNFKNGLLPGQTGKLQFTYNGSVDERICFLDIDDDKLKERHGPDFITTSQKRHAILEEDCIVLTPESVWYPIPGWTFGSRIAVRPLRQFSNYILKVSTESDIIPVSQGLMEKDGEAWVYTSETALPGISLVAANYEEKKIMVDSLEFFYYHLPGHDVFTSQLPLIKDTLPAIISETLMDYERQLGLEYPYKSLKFVEAPVQFYAYERIWTLTQDYVQPQMVLFPEKGCFLQRGNLKREFDRSVRRSAERDDGRTDEEMQVGVFNNFIKSNFVEGSQSFSFRMGMGRGGPSFSSDSEKPYLIFPNYFYYINKIESEEYQIINATLESFMGNQTTETSGFMRNFGGIQDSEQANLALSENSLEELLKMEDDKNVLPKVIESKGTYLFNYLEAAIGSDEFRTFILDLMAQNRFRSIDIQVLADQLKETYDVDLNSFLKRWYYEKELSSFLVTDVSNIELQSGDNTVYQIYFTISNIGDSEGVINVTFRTGGRGPGRGRGGGGGGFSMAGRDENTDRLYIIPAKTAQRVGLVMDDQVRMMSVNTLISNNLPASISYPFPELEQRNNLEVFDGILPADLVTTLVQEGEIVVDNEDPGFSIHEESGTNKLSKWLSIDQKDSEFKYQPMMGWWGGAPLSWTATAQSVYYGDIIRSAYYIRSGDGNKYVEWTTEIEEEGYYDVFTYLDDMLKRMGRGRGRGGDRGGRGGGEQESKDEYHFTITHSDGTEEITLGIKNIEDGWNNLGSYYFSAGKTSVTLSDKNVGRMVIADAIKWVKQ